MAIVRYIPNQGALDHYYKRQSGGGGQYFSGPVYQQGHGIGGLFGKIFRAAVPVFKGTVAPALKRGAKAVAREALSTGVGIASDMLDGGSGSKSARRRGSAAAKRLGRKGVNSLRGMLGDLEEGKKEGEETQERVY